MAQAVVVWFSTKYPNQGGCVIRVRIPTWICLAVIRLGPGGSSASASIYSRSPSTSFGSGRNDERSSGASGESMTARRSSLAWLASSSQFSAAEGPLPWFRRRQRPSDRSRGPPRRLRRRDRPVRTESPGGTFGPGIAPVVGRERRRRVTGRRHRERRRALVGRGGRVGSAPTRLTFGTNYRRYG